MDKIKKMYFSIEGDISAARKIAENIINQQLYNFISDWDKREKYVAESLKSAIYNGETTTLYYEFAPIQQPEGGQEA